MVKTTLSKTGQRFMRPIFKSFCLSALCCVALSAHANLSEVTDQGTTENAVFPDIKDAWIKEGRYPNVMNLSMIHAGMTRDQIMALIEYPIFTEGFRVREWDYIFNFNVTEGSMSRVVVCQFKVLFDKDKRAQSFYWKPVTDNATCPPMLNRQAPVAPATVSEALTLSADALFAFDRSDLAHLTLPVRTQLADFAKHVNQQARSHQRNNQRVRVTAYSDRLGSTAYNLKLSQARANTVRQLLTTLGVRPEQIDAIGAGESNPVATCDNHKGADLVTCLQPNRRVTIELQ